MTGYHVAIHLMHILTGWERREIHVQVCELVLQANKSISCPTASVLHLPLHLTLFSSPSQALRGGGRRLRGWVKPCCHDIIAVYGPYIPWIHDLLGTFLSFCLIIVTKNPTLDHIVSVPPFLPCEAGLQRSAGRVCTGLTLQRVYWVCRFISAR